MTAEALQLYARKLTDNGVVVLHISNRYLDLDSVLGATLPLVPELKGLIVSDDKADGSYAQNTSTIAVFAKNQAALDAFRAVDGAQDFHAGRRVAVDGRRLRYPAARFCRSGAARNRRGPRGVPSCCAHPQPGLRVPRRFSQSDVQQATARSHAGRRDDGPAYRAAGAHQDFRTRKPRASRRSCRASSTGSSSSTRSTPRPSSR